MLKVVGPSYSVCGRRPTPLKAQRILRAGSGKMAVKGALQDPFYNRAELDYFKSMFMGQPVVATLLVGPCGTTLKELRRQYNAQEIGPLLLYIDSRVTSVRNPDELSKVLIDDLEACYIQNLEKYIGRPRLKELESSLKIKFKWLSSPPFFKGGLDAELAREMKEEKGDLLRTILKYRELLKALESLPRKPVIVIDEAQHLMEWKEPDPFKSDVRLFLNFLIAISKQDHLAHVVLASTDYSLAWWLSQLGMNAGRLQVDVLGDLTEEEAEKFVYGDGVAGGWPGIINGPYESDTVPPGAQEQWPAIYERCGGNIALLERCVAEARAWGNWDSALVGVVAGFTDTILRGFEPDVYTVQGGEAPLWTKRQWKMVLERITTAPYHAVSERKIEKELGQESEEEGYIILLSMQKYNLLEVRPYSPGESDLDLPQEVFGKLLTPVVTLPSPAHVWAAKAVLKAMNASG